MKLIYCIILLIFTSTQVLVYRVLADARIGNLTNANIAPENISTRSYNNNTCVKKSLLDGGLTDAQTLANVASNNVSGRSCNQSIVAKKGSLDRGLADAHMINLTDVNIAPKKISARSCNDGTDSEQLAFEIGSAKQKATNIAKMAAMEAVNVAGSQEAAGQAAACQVKAQLAHKALQSAKVAEAALNGKHAIYQNLKKELRQAKADVQLYSDGLETMKRIAAADRQAVRNAEMQIEKLKRLLLITKEKTAWAQVVSENAEDDIKIASHWLMFDKERNEKLEHKLKNAKTCLWDIEKAAMKAGNAAKTARVESVYMRQDGNEMQNAGKVARLQGMP